MPRTIASQDAIKGSYPTDRRCYRVAVPPFRHRLRVRYNECDAQSAVFNANYLLYFDVAITEMWRDAFGSYEEALRQWGLDLVVAEANVRFLRPARFDDELDIDVTTEKIGTTSLTLRFDVRRGPDEIALGLSRYVFVDLDGGAKAAIPDDVRAILERYSD
jgi:acyl-CoA thioester hydrolase